MVRQITKAGIAVTLLAMALHAGTAGAHGKVTMEEDSCMRRVGENMIHLSTYQPHDTCHRSSRPLIKRYANRNENYSGK